MKQSSGVPRSIDWRCLLMRKISFYLCLIIITGVISGAAASEDPARIQRTYKVFSAALDKLLLETPHVYIRMDHKTDSFYLDNFGPVFTAHISITSSASLPEIVEKWSQWFQTEDGQIIINTKKKKSEEKPGDGDGGTPETVKTPWPPSPVKDIKADDQKRLKEMQSSIEAFTREVNEVVLDFGPIIQGVRNDDRLAVIFHVADEEFFDHYQTHTLQVQIEMDALTDLSGKSADGSAVKKAFRWNIDK